MLQWGGNRLPLGDPLSRLLLLAGLNCIKLDNIVADRDSLMVTPKISQEDREFLARGLL